MREQRVINLLILPIHDQVLLVNIINKGDDLMERLLKSMLDIILNRLVHVRIYPFYWLQTFVLDVLLL